MNDETKITAIHADDHRIVRNSVKSLLNEKGPHIKFVGEAASYPELIDLLEKVPCDVVLLDGELLEVQYLRTCRG